MKMKTNKTKSFVIEEQVTVKTDNGIWVIERRLVMEPKSKREAHYDRE